MFPQLIYLYSAISILVVQLREIVEKLIRQSTDHQVSLCFYGSGKAKEIMAWCTTTNSDDVDNDNNKENMNDKSIVIHTKECPSCGHQMQFQQHCWIEELPGLPAGVRFDPSDQELLEHLEGKVRPPDGGVHKLHPLINEFISTIDGDDGICYTHPEKLPGLSRDGLVRHFFHRPSKAYTTGNRKRRKVQTDEDGSETRWHKTGKTRPVFVDGKVKGYKKILVLYSNYGKQRKPEKTNWVMHQYHIGEDDEEKEGELVVSKVFYQTRPRQCSNVVKEAVHEKDQDEHKSPNRKETSLGECYSPSPVYLISQK